MNRFQRTAFYPADILLPEGIDFQKWSVVACDQYTSEPAYWEQVERTVDGAPSSLHVIFPEIYLENSDYGNRIASINQTMEQYINNGLFKTLHNSFIYVERTVANGKIRKGLVGAIDLEAYDYRKGAKALVRATEGTVLERIPPRVKIRINAPLEFPHIMLLIDDPADTVIGSVQKEGLSKVYDFDLMEQSGHITGYQVPADEKIADALGGLLDKQGDDALLYAVGDGNHSLATAKECWTLTKEQLSPEELENHPARFALVELVNIHDESLIFEPIHRVVFGCDTQKLVEEFQSFYPSATREKTDGQQITFITKQQTFDMYVKNPPSELAVGTLQLFLDNYLKNNQGRIDYIHGDDVTEKLAKESDKNIGFLLPAMEKSDLFKAVLADGALPRKTFSMGIASEKRFYLEGRKIK